MKPCLFLSLAISVSASAETTEHWYTISLSDANAGWMRMQDIEAENLRITSSQEHMTLGRGGTSVTIESTTQWTVDGHGHPIRMEWKQDLGGAPVTTTWSFQADGIEVAVAQDGRRTVARHPLPEVEWLTPMGVRELLESQAKAGAKRVICQTMVPDLGLAPVSQTYTRVGSEELSVFDRTVSTTRWNVQTEGMPIQMDIWFDPSWTMVRTKMQAPFGALQASLSTKEEAMRDTGEEPELFISLFIYPTGDANALQHASRALFRLRSRNGEPLEMPTAGAQTVMEDDEEGILLQIDRDGRQPPQQWPVDPATSGRSALIDPEDEEVMKLAAQVMASIPDSATDFARADGARELVYRWVTRKGLATAFASASETARSRTGDCTEHGVLLAAILRSMGIPSRVATGLVWIEGVNAFGWHLWTQALLNGEWVDLDATREGPFSAGHILVATSPMQDSDGQRQLMALLGMLGNLDIEIVQLER